MDLVAGKTFAPERRPIRHVDPVLLLAVGGHVISGLFMVYSATHQSLDAIGADPGTYLKRQATFAALGMVVVMLAASFDYRFLKVYAGIIYGTSILLLVLVRTPLGTSVKGSQRWFDLFGFQLGPSELAKVAPIIMLAAFLSEIRRSSADLSLLDVYRATAIAAVPGVLVFLQPDLGTSIVLMSILHEMGHVLGIGSLWALQGLIQNRGSSDPWFSGPTARAAFLASTGPAGYTGNVVPVENTGGTGTRDSHWRESVATNELMTGFLNTGSNPLSAITGGSLRDQGYLVNDAASDQFSLAAFLRDLGARAVQLQEAPLPGPVFTVTRRGGIVRAIPRY